MKMRCIMALCGAMAFVLAGCGSEIVESAVTETQVIDVNEPSAVEQAMESADYEFIDETQPLLDFKKEYENLTAAEEIQNAEDKAYESFYFAAVALDEVEFSRRQKEGTSTVTLPDDTCITPQQAANAAGKAAKLADPEAEHTVYLVCIRLANQGTELDGRLAYYVMVNRKTENARPGDEEPICGLVLDAVTGEMLLLTPFDKTPAAEIEENEEAYAQSCKTELQNYLDAVGAGQTCGEVALTSEIDNGIADFEVQIDSIRFYGSMKNGKLTYVERDYS